MSDWKSAEDLEEEELDETIFKSQQDAVLFAIDVSASMLSSSPDSKSESPTTAALKCAYEIMQQRIISSPKDMMGVLLFGTQETKFQDVEANSRGGLAYPHCYFLNDLAIPSAEDVLALRDLVHGDEEAQKVLIPSDEPVSMANLLFCANQVFTTRAPNFGSRRLFIITDNDEPHGGDKTARSAATVRAKDLYDLGVMIELFPISHPDHEFDRKKFYDDIIYNDPDAIEAGLGPMNFKATGGNGISLLNSLISDINSKQVAKRTLFSGLPFEIGPGFKITVKGYNICQKQKPARTCFVYQGGEKSQIAMSETAKLTGSTAEVEKAEIKKAYKFGGGTVLFTPEEQKSLRNFGPPVLRIIGFKPKDQLPFWASIKKSTFIYPSENDYTGSTRVFSALWQKLLKDDKVALAWYIARANATPAFVAIMPSSERSDQTGKGQVIPQGLWIYPLPVADDIRYPPEMPEKIVAPQRLVDAMFTAIKQIQLPKGRYDPSKYPNPSLQWHYKIIQAIALEDEVPESADFKDKTVPRYSRIDQRTGEYIHGWGVELEEQYQALESERKESKAIKRSGEDETGAPAAKKARTTKASRGLESMSKQELKLAIAKSELKGATVAELKDFLHSKGLGSSGKKDDLIERIEQWVEGE